jgi:TRAP-type C4-dicarboxylate transport system substrate-binding protein
MRRNKIENQINKEIRENIVIKKLVILTSAMLVSTNAMAAEKTMRCSHQLPPTHHIAKVIEQWAAEVEKQSSNSIDVQVFGANSLRGAKLNIPAVAKGDIECAYSVNFQWGKTVPLMSVTLRPYTLTSLDKLRKWDGSDAAKFLEGKLLEKGVRNVNWLFTTRMSAYTSKGKALIAPADFKGIKIRGINSLNDAGLTALGAAPSAMSGSKVYQALSTGVIDAGLTDISATVSRKYYEVQDHVTASPLFSVFFHGYVNPTWYDGLSDMQKTVLDNAGKKAAQWALDATEASAKDAPQKLREKGVKVHMHTAAENAAMEAVMGPAFDKAFAEATGDDGKKLLKIISKM